MARFPSMTINQVGEAREKSWWVYTLLGVVLLFAGAFVLANLVFASAVSAIWIAWAIIVAGVYQILQALKGRDRGGSRSICSLAFSMPRAAPFCSSIRYGRR
jgi:uncharacterized membrane protein HdeD (DUF308 family)